MIRKFLECQFKCPLIYFLSDYLSLKRADALKRIGQELRSRIFKKETVHAI